MCSQSGNGGGGEGEPQQTRPIAPFQVGFWGVGSGDPLFLRKVQEMPVTPLAIEIKSGLVSQCGPALPQKPGQTPAGFRLQGFDCCLPVLGGRREQVDRVRRAAAAGVNWPGSVCSPLHTTLFLIPSLFF